MRGLFGDVKIKGNLSCNVHDIMGFRILGAENRVKSKLTALDFSRAAFGLFRALLGKNPRDKALEGSRRKLVNIQGSLS